MHFLLIEYKHVRRHNQMLSIQPDKSTTIKLYINEERLLFICLSFVFYFFVLKIMNKFSKLPKINNICML